MHELIEIAKGLMSVQHGRNASLLTSSYPTWQDTTSYSASISKWLDYITHHFNEKRGGGRVEGEDEWEREEGGKEGERECVLSGVFSYRCVRYSSLASNNVPPPSSPSFPQTFWGVSL